VLGGPCEVARLRDWPRTRRRDLISGPIATGRVRRESYTTYRGNVVLDDAVEMSAGRLTAIVVYVMYLNASCRPLSIDIRIPTTRALSERMAKGKPRSDEAIALERVVDAAREVHAASIALEASVPDKGSEKPSTLQLARFTAAMQELRDADRPAPDTRRRSRRLLSRSLARPV
jgi:hypothetical protein